MYDGLLACLVRRPSRRGRWRGLTEGARIGIAEIAMVRQVHPLTGQAAIAHALDLQHRLPLVWERVGRAGGRGVGGAQGRQHDPIGAARKDRHRRPGVRHHRDRVTEPGAAVAQAKIIEADPAAHAAKAEAERRRRYVALCSPTSTGRATSSPASPPAMRCGSTPCSSGSPTSSPPTTPRRAPPATSCARSPSGGSPARRGCWLFSWADEKFGRAAKHGRKAVLDVHPHEAALLGLTTGVARVEGLGRCRWLSCASCSATTCTTTVKPVKDLADRVPALLLRAPHRPQGTGPTRSPAATGSPTPAARASVPTSTIPIRSSRRLTGV